VNVQPGSYTPNWVTSTIIQEMKVSDLNRRIVYLEDKLSSELLHIAPLQERLAGIAAHDSSTLIAGPLQERDVARELDMARLAMEGLVKQLISMTQTMQVHM
jgi:hypothetical protein